MPNRTARPTRIVADEVSLHKSGSTLSIKSGYLATVGLWTDIYDSTLGADGTGWANVTIPSGNTELEFIFDIKNAAAGDVRMTVNNTGGTNYNMDGWTSTGLALAPTYQQDAAFWILMPLSAGATDVNFSVNLSNVTGQTIKGRFNGGGLGSAGMASGGGLACDLTAAITRIDVTRSANNFLAGSRLRIRGRP